MHHGRAVLIRLSLGLGLGSFARPAEAASEPPALLDCALEKGALSTLTCQVARSLMPEAEGAAVVVTRLAADSALPAPGVLRERVRERLVQYLARFGQAPAQAAPLDGRRQRGRTRPRVELVLEVKGPHLKLTADLRRGTGLWQRVRKATPSGERHAYAEQRLDAELRELIPPPPLKLSRVSKLPSPERGSLALACGDLGKDGSQELALVSRTNIRVGRLGSAGFVELASAAWAALSPVAPAPLREPLATVVITEDGKLRVGLSDRRDGLELGATLGLLQRFESLLPAPGGGCSARAGLGYSGKLNRCAPGDQAPLEVLGGVLDALAGGAGLRVGREFGTSLLVLDRAGGTTLSDGRVGAQLAVGDADQDGAPEIIVSSDTSSAAQDSISLSTLIDGHLKKRFGVNVPFVRAIGICAEREGPGMAPIVIASEDELWVLR